MFPDCLTEWGVSGHIVKHRQNRFQAIEINAGIGVCVATFLVERQNRHEVHCLFDNGIITAQKEGETIVETFMFARPEQLKEYWIGRGQLFPSELNYLLKTADSNQYLAWHD